MTARPWGLGDEQQRWDGYLDSRHLDATIGKYVRNRVGATDYTQLRHREDTMVEARALTMRGFGIPDRYDLEGLQQIHRHLFQDVYEWAGEVRTVGLVKGGSEFARPAEVPVIMGQVHDLVEATDRLRGVGEAEFAGRLALVYFGVIAAHPFREGNGRSAREFVSALADESAHRVDWILVTRDLNDAVSEMAMRGDVRPMMDMFAAITTSRASDPEPVVPYRSPGLPLHDSLRQAAQGPRPPASSADQQMGRHHGQEGQTPQLGR